MNFLYHKKPAGQDAHSREEVDVVCTTALGARVCRADSLLQHGKSEQGVEAVGFIKNIKEEIAIIRERDAAIHSSMEVFLYPSFKVMVHYRAAHKLYLKKHYFLARWVSQRGVRKTGIEIHPGAQIGKGFFIDHGNGVIIGETTIIGDNVTLYQGVTLGGTGKEQGKRHPTLGSNIMVGAGAKVLGSCTIGDNCKIGAGSVVLEDVPPGCTVVGVPGRIVKRAKQCFPQEELDQVHLPDPVKEELTALQHSNSELTNRLLDLEQQMRQMLRAEKTAKAEKRTEDRGKVKESAADRRETKEKTETADKRKTEEKAAEKTDREATAAEKE